MIRTRYVMPHPIIREPLPTSAPGKPQLVADAPDTFSGTAADPNAVAGAAGVAIGGSVLRGLPIEFRGPLDPGTESFQPSRGTTPTTPTTGGSNGGVAQGGATPNTGGAGLAGNGPTIDALLSLFGGGMQNPLDAASSPSTAALEALQPAQAQTSSSSNPALIIVVLGAAALGAVMLFRHHKKQSGTDAK